MYWMVPKFVVIQCNKDLSKIKRSYKNRLQGVPWTTLTPLSTTNVGRAGHATILSRQRDHVSRPQSCLLLQYNYIWCSYSICRHRDLNIFLVPEALLRCREAINLLRAQL